MFGNRDDGPERRTAFSQSQPLFLEATLFQCDLQSSLWLARRHVLGGVEQEKCWPMISSALYPLIFSPRDSNWRRSGRVEHENAVVPSPHRFHQ